MGIVYNRSDEKVVTYGELGFYSLFEYDSINYIKLPACGLHESDGDYLRSADLNLSDGEIENPLRDDKKVVLIKEEVDLVVK